MRSQTSSIHRNLGRLLLAAFLLVLAASILHAAVPTVTAPSPSPQTAFAGSTVSFSVTASGTGPFTYFWQYSNGGSFTTLSDGGRISGAGSATLTITNAQTADTGNYRCLVSNASGQSNSGPGSLTVNLPPPPTVSTPGNQTVVQGNNASFSVTASGTGPFTYAWQFLPTGGSVYSTLANGGRISGATGATLTITGAQTADAGSYRCLVSNAGGQSNSGPGVLTVNLPPPPTVTAPGNQTVIQGDTASFSVTASGTGPFTYAWQYLPTGGSVYSTLSSGGRISGATSAALQITSAQTSDAGSYRCLVSNAGGQSNSGPGVLTVNLPAPPTVTAPSSQTVTQGNNASFSVAASGTGPFTYAWQFLANGGSVYTTLSNGGRISGASSSTLLITGALSADAGNYRCLVSNAGGQSNSGPATLIVNVPAPPTVTQPSNQTVYVGDAASFGVTASGPGPFTYAWQYSNGGAFTTLSNGGRISGAATGNLQISNAQTSDAGSYRCLVSNANGQTNSGPATLTVNVPTAPAVTQPANRTVYVGDAANFAVVASGHGPFTYAWQYSNGGAFVTLSDGGRISGSATATLSIANTQTMDAGTYRCLVSNTGGQSNSGPATLTVNVPTAPVVTQPVSQSVAIGSTATLSVSASGQGPLVYAWQYLAAGASAFSTLSDGGRISGSSTATLHISSVQLTDAGNYRCLVSNTVGQTNSGAAMLSVGTPDFSLAATPPSHRLTQGNTAVYTITTAAAFGFSSPIALTVSGLPTGSTYSFNPASVSPGGSSTLQVFTSGTTATGIATLTISGSSGSLTHTASVNLNMQPGQVADFVLSLSPPSVGVQVGDTASYTVSVTGTFGFSGNVTLSLSGVPAGASASFNPASVAAGGTSTLTVTTTSSTLVGTSTLSVTGTSGALSHNTSADLVVQPGPVPGAPVVDSITPDRFDGGQVFVITLSGQNFSGASVALATQQADPANPVTRVFPGVKIQQITLGGTQMNVAVDATDPNVFDYYNLVITNSAGQVTSPPFRVLAPGPMVDMWTPRRPENEAESVYVLSLVGHHLQGVTVTTNAPGSVEVFSIDSSSDDHVNGLLRVLPGAPLGDLTLIATDEAGRQVSVPITLVSTGKSLKANRALSTHRVDPDSLEVQEGPQVYFQEFEIRRPGAAEVVDHGFKIKEVPEPVHPKDFVWGISFSYTYNLVDFHWQSAILFDPVTKKTGDAILHGLGVGDRVQLGAFVLSYYLKVDLTVSIGFGSSGFSFPFVCITVTEALEIPGVNGFFNQFNFCIGGGSFAFQSGGVSSMEMSGGSCAQVTQSGPPVDGGGEVIGTVEQTDCCSQPIGVTATGQTFTGAFFGRDFNVNTSNAGTTTPGSTCQSCSGTTEGTHVVGGSAGNFMFSTKDLCIRTPFGPGKLRLQGSAQNLCGTQVIPEHDLSVISPTNNVWYDSDGMYQRGQACINDTLCPTQPRQRPRTSWYKVPNDCDVTLTIGPNGTIDGWEYCCNACAVQALGNDGLPHWTDVNNSQYCHDTFNLNPFCNSSLPQPCH